MIRRPPRLTLFPSTPLFRSSKGWADVYIWKLGGQYFILDGGDGQAEVPPGEYIIRITVNPPFSPVKGEPCPNVEDRKSTRLNSSHLVISYAVFCLKNNNIIS